MKSDTPPLLYTLALKALRVLRNEGIRGFFTRSWNYLFGETITEGLAVNFKPSSEALKKMKEGCHEFTYRPEISIVLAVRDTDHRRLGASIESVLHQVYDHWELCIAGDETTDPNISQLIESYRKNDERIKVQYLRGTPGVSVASNAAIALTTGEFIGFLDHGDELLPSALYEVVRLLNKSRDADFVYSDDVLLDESDEPIHTVYRPDFSMDYMLSHCYIGRLSVIRTGMIHKVCGFRSELDLCRDYDLFLRIFSETRKVCHIPKILYLRRQHGPDTGQAPMPNIMNSNRKAIQDFLDREGIDAEVRATEHAYFFRVQRRIIGNPKISIVIPTKDRVDLLKRCIESIEERTSYKNYEVIIVDNLSQEADTFEYLASIRKHKSMYQVVTFKEDFNFSRLNNFAVQYAVGEHLLFLNNDVEIINPGWLEAMLEHSQRDEIGCVGAKLLYSDGKIQHVGVVIGLYGGADHIYKWHESNDIGYMGQFVSIRNCSAVTAACMMVKKRIFDQVDGFDDTYRVGFGDTDFCLRVREKGYSNVYTPYAELYHHESATRGQSLDIDPHLEDTRRFMKRWQQIIQEVDPFYNPNLPLNSQPAQGQKVF